MKLAIDASNISSGGGLNHLVCLLANVDMDSTAFNRVYVWGSSRTLSRLEKRPWLTQCTHKLLDGNLFARSWWKLRHLSREVVARECDVLFAPGGSYTGSFHPFVTMSRNMLPFEWQEMRRFGFSVMLVKLLILRFVQTRTFRHADGIIFLTRYARQEVMKVAGSTRAASIVIPHGIKPSFLNLPDSGKRGSQGIHIIYVSIIDMYKHQWEVVKAVQILRERGHQVSIEFIGPAYGRALKKFRKALKKYDPKGEYTIYRGTVDNDRLPEYYASADICLFASTCENMPNILLEGMAAGLPVASSKKPPMPDILGDAGVYFDAEDPDDIARALEKLLASADFRESLAEKSYRIAEQYSWPETAAATFAFLEKTAAGGINR